MLRRVRRKWTATALLHAVVAMDATGAHRLWGPARPGRSYPQVPVMGLDFLLQKAMLLAVTCQGLLAVPAWHGMTWIGMRIMGALHSDVPPSATQTTWLIVSCAQVQTQQANSRRTAPKGCRIRCHPAISVGRPAGCQRRAIWLSTIRINRYGSTFAGIWRAPWASVCAAA